MENKNKPAFPVDRGPHGIYPGLSKREYTAIRIMQGISGSDRYKGLESHEMADRAVELTDAILSALEK